MTITNKGDLSYPIFILNKNGDKINITDCNEFVAKFYTTDININAVSSYIDKQYTNIDDNKCIINSSDLSLMENGVLHYEYTYSIEDSSYEDNYYNASIAGDTNYYIKLDNTNSGQTGSTRAEWGNIAGNINNQTDLIQKLNDKSNKADVYNKNEVDDKIDNIQTGNVDLSNYYSKSETYNKSEVDKKISDINIPSYDDTLIKSSLSNKVDKVSGKSLLLDTEIQRLSTLNNYDDTSIKSELINKANKSETYTKNEVNKIIDSIQTGTTVDLSDYYNKTEVDNKIDNINIPVYDDTSIKSSLNNKVDKLTGKGLSTNDYTTEDKNKLASLSNYNDTELKTTLLNKVDKIEGKSLVSDTEILRLTNVTNYDDTAIKSELSNKANSNNVYTKKEIDDKNYLTSIPDTLVTKEYVDNKIIVIPTAFFKLNKNSTTDDIKAVLNKEIIELWRKSSHTQHVVFKSEWDGTYITVTENDPSGKYMYLSFRWNDIGGGHYLRLYVVDANYNELNIWEENRYYVEEEKGKGLSTNDYTTEDKNKLAGLSNYDDSELRTSLFNKVDKVEGKQLSTNDYTTEDKNKLAGLSNYDDTTIKLELSNKQNTLQAGTNITISGNVISSTDTVYNDSELRTSLFNKVDKIEGKSLVSDTEILRLTNVTNYDDTAIKNSINNKVDKISGKGLSTNDYTTVEKNKLAGLSNYNDTTIKTDIANKANKADVYDKATSDTIYLKADSIVISTSEPDPSSNALIWFKI